MIWKWIHSHTPIWAVRNFILVSSLLLLGLAAQTPCKAFATETEKNLVRQPVTQDELKGPVKSIVSLYGAFNEILLALEAGNLIAARTDSDSDIPELAKLPSIGTHMRPNAELIIAARPQAVLGLKGRHDSMASLQALSSAGIPVILLELDNFEQLFEATRLLGKLSGKEERAKTLIESWQARLETLRKSWEQGPKAQIFYEARYPNLLAAGAKGITNAIIEAAGGENVIKIPRRLVRINDEWLLEKDPDIYLIQQGPMNPTPTPLYERASLRTLKAARDAIIVDEKQFSRPGPRSIEAAEMLAKKIRDFYPGRERGAK